MVTSGGEQVRSRAHPMVPSARPEEECGGLATCACGTGGSGFHGEAMTARGRSRKELGRRRCGWGGLPGPGGGRALPLR